MDQPTNKPQPFVAYVLPFGLFLLWTSIENTDRLQPYYPWMYVAKIVVVSTAFLSLRRAYPQPSASGLAWGIVIGAVGFAVWIGLVELSRRYGLSQWAPSWLVTGSRVGFNPFVEITSPLERSLFLVSRFFGLVVLVPLIEEIFWRGFLLRFLISDRFESVPVGTFSPLSFVAVTALFALTHTQEELLAAIVWTAHINGLLYSTRNLWACVLAHAVTNLLLGIYILVVQDWSLW